MIVFLGGSRNIKMLTLSDKQRLDNIINGNIKVVIGDCYGADRAFQQYLFEKSYQNVDVYAMNGYARNNVGYWRVMSVIKSGSSSFYYAEKDRLMANIADYGFMLWDGGSKGTVANIKNLTRQGKSVLVSFAEKHYLLKTEDETRRFLACFNLV